MSDQHQLKIKAEIEELNAAVRQTIGFFKLLEEKYGVTQAIFSNPYHKDVILDWAGAKNFFVPLCFENNLTT